MAPAATRIAVDRRDAELPAMIDCRCAPARRSMHAPPREQRARVRAADALARMARDEVARPTLGFVLLVARRDS